MSESSDADRAAPVRGASSNDTNRFESEPAVTTDERLEDWLIPIQFRMGMLPLFLHPLSPTTSIRLEVPLLGREVSYLSGCLILVRPLMWAEFADDIGHSDRTWAATI